MTGEPSLFLEPWGLTPDQIADLTDDQIERCYVRPAVKRAEEMERVRDGKPSGPVASMDETRPSRATFVASMVAEFGGDPAKWNADYDRLETAWLAAEAKG